MLARAIASYIEKNRNLKIGVQGAMLVSTNETITVKRLRMTPTKIAKRRVRKRKNVSQSGH
jgi:hypothetical protein